MKKDTLLIELRTEELPPKVLEKLGKSFAVFIFEGLIKENLLDKDEPYRFFATPRRLGVMITNVMSEQLEQEKIKKGPSVALGMVDNKPSKALCGFLRANSIQLEDLEIISDGKQDVYCYRFIEKGVSLAVKLQELLKIASKKLPVPKLMHWGDKPYHFVRPVHGLVAMFGKEIMPVEMFGLKATNRTLGHRFMSQGEIRLNQADEYPQKLSEYKVVVDFQERKQMIKNQLAISCTQENINVVADEALFDEVTGLVEWPVVLKGTFESEFLAVPPECLILTMQKNQKYFPLIDHDSQLLNLFLLVANLESEQPEEIIFGNERVVRARLSDAAFFYDVDKKNRLDSRLDQLKQVVYHNQIGSQYERTQRLMEIASKIAELMQIDISLARRAAQLAKVDLLTQMVGEFPELQGIMGKYYALNDQEPQEVAFAIEQHYWPRFSNDELPRTELATAVSLADKLESLIGIWGIGLIPTGNKDPYALRRLALGIIRMLLNYPLKIKQLLKITFDAFPAGLLNNHTVAEVYDFILTRLAIFLHADFENDIVAACLANKPDEFYSLKDILHAIKQFKSLPEAFSLAEVNKRVINILKKNQFDQRLVDETKLIEKEEKELWKSMQIVSRNIEIALQDKKYQQALNVLADIKPQVDEFFLKVLVMTDDEAIKQNRLNLLQSLAEKLNAVADISQLVR